MNATWFELHRTIVMPALCDAYGHMNVRHYAAIFDEAGWHVLARAGVSLTDLRARGLGTVVASLTIDFHRELTAGQLVLVTGAITRVGQKSLHYEMRLYEADSMTHCATQKTIEVCFDTPVARRRRCPTTCGRSSCITCPERRQSAWRPCPRAVAQPARHRTPSLSARSLSPPGAARPRRAPVHPDPRSAG